jgi:hypothetical protein
MPEFWYGFMTGGLIGGSFGVIIGVLIMGISAAAKRGDEDINYTARDILDLNERDHSIAPGSEDDRRTYADRHSRDQYLR